MLSLSVASLMVVAALAQPQRENCCTPMQWEGHDDDVVGFAGHEGKEAMLVSLLVFNYFKLNRKGCLIYIFLFFTELNLIKALTSKSHKMQIFAVA